MKVPISDPLFNIVGDSIESEFTSLPTWKGSCISKGSQLGSKLTFIILDNSRYLVAVDGVGEKSTVVGVWDSATEVGEVRVVYDINLLYYDMMVISSNNLSPYNFTIEKVKKSFESEVLEVLQTLVSSPTHSSMSTPELAMKAVSLVNDMHLAISARNRRLFEKSKQ